ncbi:MAG: hypothetical protein Q4E03_04700 [Trueperella sp.]|nr:hypothetical protein [Trueperella sp.]
MFPSELLDYLTAPGRLIIGIDGRSGAGKTSFARQLAQCTDRDVLQLEVEEFIAGWDGLSTGIADIAEQIVRPLREQGWTTAAKWDWWANEWHSPSRIPPTGSADLIFLTGCGATAKPIVPYLDLTIWLDAPAAVRKERVRRRDSYDWSAQWEQWAAQESQLLAQYPSDQLADFKLQTG